MGERDGGLRTQAGQWLHSPRAIAPPDACDLGRWTADRRTNLILRLSARSRILTVSTAPQHRPFGLLGGERVVTAAQPATAILQSGTSHAGMGPPPHRKSEPQTSSRRPPAAQWGAPPPPRPPRPPQPWYRRRWFVVLAAIVALLSSWALSARWSALHPPGSPRHDACSCRPRTDQSAHRRADEHNPADDRAAYTTRPPTTTQTEPVTALPMRLVSTISGALSTEMP
jgi:hypothetical protein